MVPRLAPLVVVALLVTAGCLGTTGTDPGADDSTTTVQTTRSTTGTTTGGTTAPPTLTDEFAPGVSTDGVENVSALLSSHVQVLADRGFAVAANYTLTNASDGDGQTTSTLVTADAGLTEVRSHSEYVRNGTTAVRDQWATESSLLIRSVQSGEASYQANRYPERGEDGALQRARYFARVHTLADVLRDGEYELVGVEQAGDERFATFDVAFPNATESGFDAESARVVVSSAGYLRSLSATGTTPGGDVEVELGYAVERLGVDDVDRPAWLSEAPEPVDVRPTLEFRNCTHPYLELSVGGESALPAGSTVSFTANGTSYEVTLSTAVESGDVRYVYLSKADGAVASETRPSGTDLRPMPNELSYTVATDDGLTLVNGGMGFGCGSATSGSGEGSSDGAGSSGSETTAAEGSASDGG